MKQAENNATSFPGLLLTLISNMNLLFRSVVALILLLGVVWVGVLTAWYTLQWLQPKLQVEFRDTGAVVFSPTRTNQKAVFQLSSNGGVGSAWIDTGIRIEQGKKVTIIASGKVCLAFHHMRQGEYVDKPPPQPWVDPDGLSAEFPPRTIREEEGTRAQLKVAKALQYGRVIGVISEPDLSGKPRDTTTILDIGKKATFKSKQTGNLWLTVNDIWLDELTVQKITDKDTKWKELIATQKYWNVWYDDNSGSFLVSIEIEP